MEPERLVVGRIVKPHGIRGEVAVLVLSDAPDRFAPGARMIVGDRALTIAGARRHQGRLLVTFDGIADRTAAEDLRGLDLEIDASDARPLPEDAFYPHELEGFEVIDTDGRVLGRFLRVEDNPAHDHWIVDAGARREVMVPAVKQIVVGVDRDARRIMLDPPEGLF